MLIMHAENCKHAITKQIEISLDDRVNQHTSSFSMFSNYGLMRTSQTKNKIVSY